MSRLTRRMAHALRHAPEAHGLRLSERGSVPIATLAAAMGTTPERVVGAARECPKQRFVIEGESIRAAQGHSVPIAPVFVASAAPRMLWHGTRPEHVASIREHGLRPGARTHVHLTSSRTVAAARGGVILAVSTAGIAGLGMAANGVWLAPHVPPTHIKFTQGKGKQ